jgi:hypothetical protein
MENNGQEYLGRAGCPKAANFWIELVWNICLELESNWTELEWNIWMEVVSYDLEYLE